MDVFMSRVLEFKSSSDRNKKNSIYTNNYKGFLKVTELISQKKKVKRRKNISAREGTTKLKSHPRVAQSRIV